MKTLCIVFQWVHSSNSLIKNSDDIFTALYNETKYGYSIPSQIGVFSVLKSIFRKYTECIRRPVIGDMAMALDRPCAYMRDLYNVMQAVNSTHNTHLQRSNGAIFIAGPNIFPLMHWKNRRKDVKKSNGKKEERKNWSSSNNRERKIQLYSFFTNATDEEVFQGVIRMYCIIQHEMHVAERTIWADSSVLAEEKLKYQRMYKREKEAEKSVRGQCML